MYRRLSFTSGCVALVLCAGVTWAPARPAAAEPPSASTAPFECPDGMLPVPGGRFVIGDDEGRYESPAHEIAIDSFCLSRLEVTQAEYSDCVESGLCSEAYHRPMWDTLKARQVEGWSELCSANNPERGDYPVSCVTLSQARRYCAAQGGRLPTDAEWEYAARGGDEQRRWPWGDFPPGPTTANFAGTEASQAVGRIRGGDWVTTYPASDGYAFAAPVGSFPAGVGRWGHLDLSGNVCEFVEGVACPLDRDQCFHLWPMALVRGNHFLTNNLEKTRAARRNWDYAYHRGPNVGIRCAAEPGPQGEPTVGPAPRIPELPPTRRVVASVLGALITGAAAAAFGLETVGFLMPAEMYGAVFEPQKAVSTAALTILLALTIVWFRRAPTLPQARSIPLLAVVATGGAGAAAAVAHLPPQPLSGAVVAGLVALLLLLRRRTRAPLRADSEAPRRWVLAPLAAALFGATGTPLLASSIGRERAAGLVAAAAGGVLAASWFVGRPPDLAFAAALVLPTAAGLLIGESIAKRTGGRRWLIRAIAVYGAVGALFIFAREVLPDWMSPWI
ncbi:MAG: SUMF1/EgtB/PvdO family nonheme iron enzyme [Myxococcales bacterium]|nr:SUMF1/EgtB/PvdO family nonheme iron enzyme [Myxococcales bacterium]